MILSAHDLAVDCHWKPCSCHSTVMVFEFFILHFLKKNFKNPNILYVPLFTPNTEQVYPSSLSFLISDYLKSTSTDTLYCLSEHIFILIFTDTHASLCILLSKSMHEQVCI